MVTVHTKPDCQQCVATKRKLGRLGVPYVEVELTEESVARFKRFGHLSAPVVIAGAETWSGFQPDRLEAYANTQTTPTPEGEEPE